MNLVGQIVDRILGLPPARVREAAIEVERNLAIPMPDGAVLLADRYRPSGRAAMPAVLVRTPYGRRGLGGAVFGAAYARQGLQVVVQSVRGTFGSGGEFRPLHQEKEDGLATAAWLRAQPWCDGRLATAGLSYFGYTQWALGPYLDPPLEAVCLGVTTSEFNSHHYPGGSFALHGALSWSALTSLQEAAPLGGILLSRRQARRTAQAMAHLPLREADTVAIGRPSAFWQDVVGHSEPGDGFWAAADHSAAVAGLTSPATMVTGWHDLFLPWQLRDFRTLSDAGRTARITIGPWAHADLPALKAQILDQASWLRAHLLGDAVPERAPVRVHLQHARSWREFTQWPPPQSTPTPLYLRQDGALDWRSPPSAGSDRFTYDPADPTPTVGGPLIDGKNKQQDNRAIEARPDVLVYSTSPLERDLDVLGEVRARVHVRTDPGHADVFVRLCDVDERGVSRNVCDGILRLRPGSPPPGEDGAVAADIEMWPTGYRFLRGHRIRVLVAGGAFPRFPRNHGTGEPVADAVTMRPCLHEVLHDPAHPSHVLVPVLADGDR
jgi:hypothetical protein